LGSVVAVMYIRKLSSGEFWEFGREDAKLSLMMHVQMNANLVLFEYAYSVLTRYQPAASDSCETSPKLKYYCACGKNSLPHCEQRQADHWFQTDGGEDKSNNSQYRDMNTVTVGPTVGHTSYNRSITN
jgi:hypothetical protein